VHPQLATLLFAAFLLVVGACFVGAIFARFREGWWARLVVLASLSPLPIWGWLMIASPHKLDRGMTTADGLGLALIYLTVGTIVGAVALVIDRASGGPICLMTAATLGAFLSAMSYYIKPASGDGMASGMLFLVASVIALVVAGYVILLGLGRGLRAMRG
jgi:hypothetical protein